MENILTVKSYQNRKTAASQFPPDDRGAGANEYVNSTGYKTWRDPSGNPAITPPWGTLSAINMATGDFAWQLPLGNDTNRQVKGALETGQEVNRGRLPCRHWQMLQPVLIWQAVSSMSRYQ